MLTLTISHHLFLTKNERYKITNGEPIEIIGVAIPVWFLKGTTSEPAKEIFCKYSIFNQGDTEPIFSTKEGFQLNLPTMIENQDATKLLLDIKDGGTECLFYREFNQVKKPVQYDIIHYVQIMPIEMMEQTLST